MAVRRALITNDDGIDSPGLLALARAARDAGWDVVVAAPAEQSSGASASITAVQRDGRTVIEPRELDGLPGVEAYAVEASPGHIVLAALRGWLDPAPDLVLSGINHGANVGRVILHSGTVGAALTAGLQGARGLAVSLDVGLEPAGPPAWDTAAQLLPRVVELLLDAPSGTVLSLNVPDRPFEKLGELRLARLAASGVVQTRVEEVHTGGLLLREVELGGEPEDGTDSALLAAGHPTLTAVSSVGEAPDRLVIQWLATAERQVAGR
ncbi:5'/3'-nucleotidase SurE [Pseudonocardia bannensis]|uniref:5'-nucleotidase n=1 Tax=Pseudonocardia bannensis TaxID=630973 RepID=A0A848DIM3_9PSEU|nr:5'/3'-nucleotidase SurE [Pseudonocardia bannensis]NMH92552.1 5'/3'-nucleotidase SurE [Pseudonocardia bannensis]